jgi:molybdate transport system ATP-binding protein
MLAVSAELSLPPGISLLFGPSGAGKTTLLSALAGLLRPDRGRIAVGSELLFDAERGIDVKPEARRIALVFQSLALFPHLTARENVAFGLPRGLSRRERVRRAQGWLERMRVAHVTERRPATFSGGEAQRVALARALASEPRALLLDEPFSAMDESLRVQLGDELVKVVQEVRIPCLLVTHDRAEGTRLSERVFELQRGQVTRR